MGCIYFTGMEKGESRHPWICLPVFSEILSVHHIGPVLTAILPFCVLILALICALIVFAEWSRKGPLTQNGPIRVPSLEFRIGTQKERELEASLYRFLTQELEGGHMFYHVNAEQREPDHRKQE